MFSVSEIYSTETNDVTDDGAKSEALGIFENEYDKLDRNRDKNGLQYQHRVRRQLIP